MKNILSITVGLLFTFMSCNNSSGKGETIVNKRTITFPEGSVAKNMDWYIIQGSDGHDYMENGDGSAYILMHYIECNKCKNK
jgi:hypothetical protein